MIEFYEWFMLVGLGFITVKKSIYVLSTWMVYRAYPAMSLHTAAYAMELAIMAGLIAGLGRRTVHTGLMVLGVGYGIHTVFGPAGGACGCLFGWHLAFPPASRIVVALGIMSGSLAVLMRRNPR